MAHSFFGNVIEFLIGWLFLSTAFTFVITFVLVYMGLELSQVVLYGKVIEGVVVVMLFYKRRALALGFLLGFLLSLIGSYGLITGQVTL